MESDVAIMISVAVIGVLLLGYGVYGFFMVTPAESMEEAVSMACPFGAGGSLLKTSNPFAGGVERISCSYSFESLIAGGITLAILVGALAKR